MTQTSEDIQVRDEEQKSKVETTQDLPVYSPATDIYEKDDSLLVVCDMPGVTESQVDVTLENNVLTLAGMQESKEPEEHQLVHHGYTPGIFRRSFTINTDIDREKICARMKNGVLKVVLPKSEKGQPKKIKVETESWFNNDRRTTVKSIIPWRSRDRALSRETANPFEELHRQMDNLFESFFRDAISWPAYTIGGRRGNWLAPDVEVTETEESFEVAAELPGLDEKDLEVTLDENALTIQGEKKQEREEKKRNYHLSERSYGRFQRVIPLPASVDKSAVKAAFKKGVLTVTLPKTGEARSERKRIAIKAD